MRRSVSGSLFLLFLLLAALAYLPFPRLILAARW